VLQCAHLSPASKKGQRQWELIRRDVSRGVGSSNEFSGFGKCRADRERICCKICVEFREHDGQRELDVVPLAGKISLEEHFVLAETIESSYAVRDLHPETRQKILDVVGGRIADMDRGGLDICILSLTAPGVQAIPHVKEAIARARRTNDYLAENIAKNPKRLKGFATLQLQDPEAAAQELTRCVRDLGFCGALVNGFSQVGEGDSALYYDLPQYRPFWATVQELDVLFYLHPRDPLSTRQQCYEGYRWLAGSPWGFAVESSIHALRLMASGLFDEYSKLKVILGHCASH
jgi:predicted TIM-barrel fold metal-dependent hydrolase